MRKWFCAAAIIGAMLCPISFGASYGGGSGTSTDPYRIGSAANWQTLMVYSSDWRRQFILTADIDLTGIPLKPVGNSNTKFSGVFNGNDHIIRNATINEPNSFYVGLFGYVKDGQIKNLGVENANIQGGTYVGGLVGYNSGAITSCYTTGTMRGSYVGGLVGDNSGTIISCYATGDVKGISHVGGLIGSGFGTITFCYATGAVDGNEYVGGLVGIGLYGTVTSCYATGAVSGSRYVGGLLGVNGSDAIAFCYSTGVVSGSSHVGGLIGMNSNSIVACFWDIQTSGQDYSSGGKGLTTEQMKSMSIYQNAGWADKGWKINNGADYPHLSWENTGGDEILPAIISFAGSGTADEPYLIGTAEEFAALSWYKDILNKRINLTANLDLRGIKIYPIGDLGPFTGVFDGNGHTLSNPVINQPGGDYVGLFGFVGSYGQINNLNVVNATIQGQDYVSVLAGNNYYGKISFCNISGVVNGTGNFIGGLVGWNYRSDITSCSATGDVNGTDFIGGLVGINDFYSGMSNCYAAVW